MTQTVRLVHAGIRAYARLNIAIALAMLTLFAIVLFSRPAAAMNIKTLKTPGGIEAWLVEEHSVPLLALRFAFEGGNSQDPPGKEGVANFITAMMDEGAGDIKSSSRSAWRYLPCAPGTRRI